MGSFPEYDFNIIEAIDELLREAVRRNASALHLDPLPDGRGRVRMRVDGVVVGARDLPSELRGELVRSLKRLAGLDLEETRLPQDGVLSTFDQEGDATFGVCTMPTVTGEAIVLTRWNERADRGVPLEELGYEGADLATLEEALSRPGAVLFAGPTHSGRHSSIYSALRRLNSPGIVIATAEAPVRVAMSGMQQCPVDYQKTSFASLLLAFRRQDVDVIALGDVMDLETAELLFEAVLRGRRVLASIHAGSARKTVDRLHCMGVKPWLLAEGLSLVVAQRLLRALCPECRAPEEGDLRAGLERAGVPPGRAASATLFRARGCKACGSSGYRGRKLIAELLPVTAAVQRAIRASGVAPPEAVARTLRQQALEAACSGLTTVAEALATTRDAH